MLSDTRLSSLWVNPIHHKGKTFLLQNVGMAGPGSFVVVLVSPSHPEITVVRVSESNY